MRLLKSKSLTFDVYGAFVRDLGGWIAVADLVTLMGQLGVEEQVVRSSVSRFTRRGLLARNKVDGQIGYALTGAANRILAEGDQRIYLSLAPSQVEDGWVLATFSVPESIRAERHQLRSRLGWLGFGNLGGGLWIAPKRVYEQTRQMVMDLGLEKHVDLFDAHYRDFDDLQSLIYRCWDIAAMRAAYREYLDEFAPVREQWSTADADADQAAAFRDYVHALHEWRKLPYIDPGLPPELLPDDWEGTLAVTLFSELRSRLERAAKRHVVRIVGGG